MSLLQISGYAFFHLTDLVHLQEKLVTVCQRLELKGTVLLSEEGINLNVVGESTNITHFKAFLASALPKIPLIETHAEQFSFRRLKIKIKKEIITFRNAQIDPTKNPAPYIQPEELKKWLDNNEAILLVDTRNEFEMKMGTFRGAMNLGLKQFSDFSKALKKIPQHKKIVTFCTGGIRCERAAAYMKQQGYEAVWQLAGGILNYFNKVGNAHFVGKCFVFDERGYLTPQLT